jgi:hypothetical protein
MGCRTLLFGSNPGLDSTRCHEFDLEGVAATGTSMVRNADESRPAIIGKVRPAGFRPAAANADRLCKAGVRGSSPLVSTLGRIATLAAFPCHDGGRVEANAIDAWPWMGCTDVTKDGQRPRHRLPPRSEGVLYWRWPYVLDLDQVRPVRDQIEQRVRTLLGELAVPARP